MFHLMLLEHVNNRGEYYYLSARISPAFPDSAVPNASSHSTPPGFHEKLSLPLIIVIDLTLTCSGSPPQFMLSYQSALVLRSDVTYEGSLANSHVS